MKVYLLIAANILILALVSYFIVDSAQQLQAAKIQSFCLQIDGRRICALCYQRDPKQLLDRAFKIESNVEIAVLKIREQQTYLSCPEYLQLVRIEKNEKKEAQIALQSMAPVLQILQEMQADYELSKGTQIIMPSFSQFVIYKWGDFDNHQTKIYFPDTNNYRVIRFYFVYGLNFVLLLVLVAWIAGSTFLAEQSVPLKICLTLMVVLVELWLLELCGQWCLFLCRLLTWNLGLLRLKVNNFKVMFMLAGGLFFTYFEVTVPIYIACIMALTFYYGKGHFQSSQIQRYLLITYSIFLINHVYIYKFVYLLNDFRNLAVDLCLIVLIPLGLFLLPNEKKFRPYRPIDPQSRSISLSGYDEEEPMDL